MLYPLLLPEYNRHNIPELTRKYTGTEKNGKNRQKRPLFLAAATCAYKLR
jgi:hypothetical protein